jgi:alkanesulfonate monooxygenase SsuD/methylene tetrahydromethanopterin reductase-like flavin-dependent oxidoreductase (luciferase family)
MEFGSFMEFHRRLDATQAEAFNESFDHVEQVERLGLDAVWLAESHFNPQRSVLSSPIVIATAIAARTKRLKVGTAVQVLPLTNPLRMAEEAATLDHISKGRFEFGIGRSGLPGSYEGYNIPYGESRERFFEALDIIRKAWTQERFSHEGKYFSFKDVCLVPKPYQTPHPLLRMAATTSESFPIAARLGIPLFIGLRVANMSQVAEQVKSYKEAWVKAGNEGDIDVSLRAPVYVAETREKALSEPEESFMTQFRRLGSSVATSVGRAGTPGEEETTRRSQQLSSVTWDEVQREKVAVGTPEMVIERLQEMKEKLELSGVVAEFNAGGLIPRENIARSLRLFCEKVAPAFK